MLSTVTHTGDKLDRAREAITDLHPWLEVDTSEAGDRRMGGAADAPADPLDVREPVDRTESLLPDGPAVGAHRAGHRRRGASRPHPRAQLAGARAGARVASRTGPTP